MHRLCAVAQQRSPIISLSSVLAFAAAITLSLAALPAQAAHRGRTPRYAHIVVIIEENKDYAQVLDGAFAPNIARLAQQYGNAARFFSEVHPSEANYVALLGGDTFGIHDDDAFYCQPGASDPYCPGAAAPGYAPHTIDAPHLGDQLQAKGLSWKGYYESLPRPGSLAVIASDQDLGKTAPYAALYASKHSGFMNFRSVQQAPDRAARIVGFDQLDADLAAGALPAFALVVPNQCNEMHGLRDVGLPPDCASDNVPGLILRGDAEVGRLVERLQATAAWKSKQNMAIVVTFDEGAGQVRGGCCAVTPDAPSNYGGGHIPTIVITNHGPRGLTDRTPYNHYSLLRTFEDAFGIKRHLAHAADTRKGVVSMTPLFAVRRSR